MNPFTWPSATSRAQIIVRSPKVALPIHFFCPFSTHESPSRRAVVSRPPEVPEPTSGSVKPKEPIFSSRAIGGSHFCFCSSEPPRKIDPIANPLCTQKEGGNEESTPPICIS